MDVKTLEKIDLKMMHSNDLRELKSMIQKELNFREDIGKEINNIKSSKENQSHGQRKVNDS